MGAFLPACISLFLGDTKSCFFSPFPTRYAAERYITPSQVQRQRLSQALGLYNQAQGQSGTINHTLEPYYPLHNYEVYTYMTRRKISDRAHDPTIYQHVGERVLVFDFWHEYSIILRPKSVFHQVAELKKRVETSRLEDLQPVSKLVCVLALIS